MPVVLRIMCYNIAEGDLTGGAPDNSKLPRLAEVIRGLCPDVVFLNEVRNERGWPYGNGVNQVEYLSDHSGLPHRHWGNTTALGLRGHKAVGVLSRYPLEAAVMHPVMYDGGETGCATLETSLIVNGQRIHVFSTRFSPVHWGDSNFDYHREQAENVAGHEQAISMLQGRAPSVPLIFGGDLNSSPASEITSPQHNNFVANCGLINAKTALPDPNDADPTGVDWIFYRGPYKLAATECRRPDGEPSDHPYLLIELMSPEAGFAVKYGGTFKFRHCATGMVLHSHPFNYGHAGTSGQQQVTGYSHLDDNNWWRVKGPHGQPDGYRAGQWVQHGEIVRLQHVGTQRNLHSHSGHPSPVTQQQEVTCFGDYGFGDDNDNWRVEVEGGGAWLPGRKVRLIHVNTNHALHSHWGSSHSEWTRGQQEVTCYSDRDDNDWWWVFTEG